MERGGPGNRRIRSLVATCVLFLVSFLLSLILSSSSKSKVWRVRSLCSFVFRKHFARVCVNTGRRRERRKSDPPKLSHCVGKFSGCRCASDSSLKTNTDKSVFLLFSSLNSLAPGKTSQRGRPLRGRRGLEAQRAHAGRNVLRRIYPLRFAFVRELRQGVGRMRPLL